MKSEGNVSPLSLDSDEIHSLELLSAEDGGDLVVCVELEGIAVLRVRTAWCVLRHRFPDAPFVMAHKGDKSSPRPTHITIPYSHLMDGPSLDSVKAVATFLFDIYKTLDTLSDCLTPLLCGFKVHVALLHFASYLNDDECVDYAVEKLCITGYVIYDPEARKRIAKHIRSVKLYMTGLCIKRREDRHEFFTMEETLKTWNGGIDSTMIDMFRFANQIDYRTTGRIPAIAIATLAELENEKNRAVTPQEKVDIEAKQVAFMETLFKAAKPHVKKEISIYQFSCICVRCRDGNDYYFVDYEIPQRAYPIEWDFPGVPIPMCAMECGHTFHWLTDGSCEKDSDSDSD